VTHAAMEATPSTQCAVRNSSRLCKPSQKAEEAAAAAALQVAVRQAEKEARQQGQASREDGAGNHTHEATTSKVSSAEELAGHMQTVQA
jgi:cobalamin biosynthesis protein CobD/CbiB